MARRGRVAAPGRAATSGNDPPQGPDLSWEPTWTIRGAPPPWGRTFSLLGLALLVLFILAVGYGTVFVEDEWPIIIGRRGGGLDTWLEPYNDHLILSNIAFYKGLMALVGINEYWPYRLGTAFVHTLCVALAFVLARRRVGPVGAALLVIPILAFGPGWEVIIFPFGIFFLSATLAALAAMLALDRGDRPGDVLASILLTVAVAASSFGIPLLAGAAAEILWRRDRFRRIWIVAVPVALYGLWYFTYNTGTGHDVPIDVGEMPLFVVHAATGTLSALLGVPLGVETQPMSIHSLLEPAAHVLALVALGALIWRVRRLGHVTPRLAMLVTTLLSFWVLTGLARGGTGQHYAGRYVYPATVLLVLLIAEVAPGLRLGRRTFAAVAVVAVGAGLLNTAWLIKDSKGRRTFTRPLAAELAAVEIMRDKLAPDVLIDQRRSSGLRVGEYLALRDELGSPALSQAQLAAADPELTAAADELLMRSAVKVVPLPQAPRPRFQQRVTGSAAAHGVKRECLYIRPPRGQTVTASMDAPAYGFSVKARRPERFQVRLRRFGTAWSPPRPLLPDRGGTLFGVPLGTSTVPWKVEITGRGRFVLC